VEEGSGGDLAVIAGEGAGTNRSRTEPSSKFLFDFFSTEPSKSKQDFSFPFQATATRISSLCSRFPHATSTPPARACWSVEAANAPPARSLADLQLF